MNLRKYQEVAVKTFFDYFKLGFTGNPLIVIPTGGGKTLILSKICAQYLLENKNKKVVILSHVSHILQQDYNTLVKFIPEKYVSIYSSGLNSKEINKCTVAGIQSVYKKTDLFEDLGLIIVDEAHRIPPDGEGYYKTFIDNFPNIPILGLTATPYRLGFGKLTDEGHIFDQVIYEANVQQLINDNYLCKLFSKTSKVKMNTAGIKIIAGDYNKKELVDRFDREKITSAICDEIIKYKSTYKNMLIFAIDIKHSEHITQILESKEIKTDRVHSKRSTADNNAALIKFKNGELQAIINVENLTTGFDFPAIDFVALLRPTLSIVLHVQMIGRGLRTAPNKEHTLILDFAGNLNRLGPIDQVTPKTPMRSSQNAGTGPAALTKTCPICDEVVFLSAKQCPCCQHLFQSQQKLTVNPSEAAVLRTQQEEQTKLFDVDRIYYKLHKKTGSNNSLKVTYITQFLTTFNEWVCFEHIGFARQRAERWWKARTDVAIPDTVEEAIKKSNFLAKPTQIEVNVTEKYPKITRYIFNDE